MSDADQTGRWHVNPSKPVECHRCNWIRHGKPGEEIPNHDRRCAFRDTGKDPEPAENGTNDGL